MECLLSLSPGSLSTVAAAAATSFPPLLRPTTTTTTTTSSLPFSPLKIKSCRSSANPTKASAVNSGYSIRLSAPPQSPPTAMRSADADVMGLLFRQRIVFLGNEIDDYVADAVISQLLLLDARDPTKDIRLFINSPGGSVSSTMAILDVVRLLRSDVSTVAMGMSASTASIILGGGTKGKRFALPNTRIMMHQPLGSYGGQALDVEVQAREVETHKTMVTRILSELTGQTYKQVEEDIDRDRYMSPIEAVEYGLIDGIIDRDCIISLAPVIEAAEASSKDPKTV